MHKIIFALTALFFCQLNAIAYDQILIVGCRPWDKNIQGLHSLQEAHFLDFSTEGKQNIHPRFYHVDFNDKGQNNILGISDFAEFNQSAFHTIIVDWMTAHHIRRTDTCGDLAKLLNTDGTLIIPVTSSNMTTGQSVSQEKALTLINDCSLMNHFNTVEIHSFDTLLPLPGIELLTESRHGIRDAAISMEPAIIFARK